MAEPRKHHRSIAGRALLALVSAGVLLLPARPVRGEDTCPRNDYTGLGQGFILLIGAPLSLLPSELGTFVHGKGADFSFGWSFQIPACLRCYEIRHRVAMSLDLLPWADRLPVRGRLGYRFATRHLIAGLGGGLDHDGFTWSPELGIKGLYLGCEANFPSLHFVVRGYLRPELDGVRGASLLLGWSFF